MPIAEWIFIDLNSYFASVEQELRPELRGQPIGVVPQLCKNTCCIAASYQAKAYGVQTGTSLDEAKALCPHIVFVEARPQLYMEFHHAIVSAIETCIPVTTVMSCDEFACSLMGRERELVRATEIAYKVKQAIRGVGGTLRCSIGLGPNQLLAKIAAEMQKPDGFMILQKEHLPRALYSLAPKDVPGIGRRMNERLERAGITNMPQLCSLRRDQMRGIWGSVLGERMYFWLRGDNFRTSFSDKPKQIGRQHVLPPEARTREKARGIALKMLHSCAAKLRRKGMWAGGVALFVLFSHPEEMFEVHFPVEECRDTITLQEKFNQLWDKTPAGTPFKISVHLYNLTEVHHENLFAESARARDRATEVMDAMNQRHGQHALYLGSIHQSRDSAPVRIPFWGALPEREDFEN